MSKRQIIMLLGVVVILLPFLGFTSRWDTVFNVVIGLIIIVIAYNLYPQSRIDVDRQQSSKETEERKENDPNLPFVDHRAESARINPNNTVN